MKLFTTHQSNNRDMIERKNSSGISSSRKLSLSQLQALSPKSVSRFENPFNESGPAKGYRRLSFIQESEFIVQQSITGRKQSLISKVFTNAC